MMRFFHVSIIWVDAAKSTETLQPIFDLAEDWMAYGLSLYVIYTSEEGAVWQGRLRAIIGANDSVFVSEISNVHFTAGWMSKQFWEWLRKDRSQLVGTTVPTLLLPPTRY